MDSNNSPSDVMLHPDPGPRVNRVADVDEAIALAQKWQAEDRYHWFRGQVHCWPPYSSLFRLLHNGTDKQEANFQARMSRFLKWMQRTPGLAAIADDADAELAIAQHHGIPTHLIDFTTDPAVAGFFAADSKGPVEPGTTGCIYCLNLDGLSDVWALEQEARKATDDEPELPDLNFVRPDVTNLWRMHAQAGVFLECAVNWDVVYPMDRIEFPYTGPPSFPTRDIVYPARRSPLEILLDQFFDNEKKLEGNVHITRMLDEMQAKGVRIGRTATVPAPSFFLEECFRGGDLPVHDSWSSATDWLVVADERLADVRHVQIQLAIDLRAAPSALYKRARAGFEQALRRHPDARSHAIHWLLEPTGAAHDFPHQDDVMKGLARLWDGMRREPFTDEQLARSMATWVALGPGGYSYGNVDERRRMAAELFGGPVVHLEFRSADGASSRGWATVRELLAAVRPDIDGRWANDEWRKRAEDPKLLLQMCYGPHRLFDFQRLLDVFVDQIGPTQLNRDEPYFFHPARLDILGLP